MDEEQIKTLYRQYWTYMIEKNADGLRKMMAEGNTFGAYRVISHSEKKTISGR